MAAAALAAGATRIVTWNIRHVPATDLGPKGIRAVTPDDLLGELVDELPNHVHATLMGHRTGLRKPPQDEGQYLEALRRNGLIRFASKL